jgi:hypothetical protein
MRATQKTVDQFKLRQYSDGKCDCIQIAIAHAARFGRKIVIPKYGDVESAARALRKLGFRTLGEAMDKHFERIDPQYRQLGDFVETPGMNGFSSIMVDVGNGRALGFHEDIPHCDILQPILISGAWSVG